MNVWNIMRRNIPLFPYKSFYVKGQSAKEVGFPESWEDGMVHPHFRDVFHAAFTGVEYGKEDQVLEILLKTNRMSLNGSVWISVKLETRNRMKI